MPELKVGQTWTRNRHRLNIEAIHSDLLGFALNDCRRQWVSEETLRVFLDGWTLEGDTPTECRLSLDTGTHVYFYEQDHYYLSNFSAFTLAWQGVVFATSEAAYHWEKFPNHTPSHRDHRLAIRDARSAHDAFKYAERFKRDRRPDWDDIKIGVMKRILFAKADQHEYVRRKLIETGDRILVENSWRDDFWGWGPNRDGENMLGKLWMEVRSELRKENQ